MTNSRDDSIVFMKSASAGLDAFLVEAREKMNTQFAGRPEDGIFTLAQAFMTVGHTKGMEYLATIAASAIGRILELEAK